MLPLPASFTIGNADFQSAQEEGTQCLQNCLDVWMIIISLLGPKSGATAKDMIQLRKVIATVL